MASLTGMATLGVVKSEHSTKDAGLFFQPIPASNSSDAVQLDIFGCTRIITITGTYSTQDAGYATIALFKAALDGLVNGAQTSKTYTDTDGVSYVGLVANVDWDRNEGETTTVGYTITFQEGSS